MKYSQLQEKHISKIVSGHQNWYVADSAIWGERYMNEKENILTQERNVKEASIIVKHLPKKCKKILDAPCGYGRITNNLAGRGFDLTGIDISSYFIDLAKKEARNKNLKVSYVMGDIFKKNVSGKFDAVLNIFTSIGYLDSEKKNELFIKKLCHYVRSGGRLIIETLNPIAILANYKEKETLKLRSGTKLYFNRFFDVNTATSVTKIREIKKGKSKELVHIIRLYFPHELISICSKYGFKLITILDQNGRKKDIKNSLRIWLVFEKISSAKK